MHGSALQEASKRTRNCESPPNLGTRLAKAINALYRVGSAVIYVDLEYYASANGHRAVCISEVLSVAICCNACPACSATQHLSIGP